MFLPELMSPNKAPRALAKGEATVSKVKDQKGRHHSTRKHLAEKIAASNLKNERRLEGVQSSLSTGRANTGVLRKRKVRRTGKEKVLVQPAGEWSDWLRGGDETDKDTITPAVLPERRPFQRMGHGSGWRKDNGLTMAQEWKRHVEGGELERRVEAKLAKMITEQKKRDDVAAHADALNSSSTSAKTREIAEQTRELEKKETQLLQSLKKAKTRALRCQWPKEVSATIPPAAADTCNDLRNSLHDRGLHCFEAKAEIRSQIAEVMGRL